jgi:hypothetical protein
MMRQLGFTFQRNVDDLFKLTKQIPPITDLLRFMVRDAADDQGAGSVVQRFQLDSQFDSKFQGKLREWAAMQGIEEEYARYAWRAHWSIPAPGQLFTMLHRLQNRPVGDNARVSIDDIKAALIQQDIPPYWIDKFIAISYRPLTRVDVRRAYDIGALALADVTTSYLDLGYDPINAGRLTTFTEKLRNSKIGGTAPIKHWKAGAIDRTTAETKLIADNYPAHIVADALAVAEKQQAGSLWVKRYAKGYITRGDAAAGLAKHGIGAATYDPWLDDASQAYRTSMPVKLFGRDLISRNDAEGRLLAFGVPAAMFAKWLDDAAAAKANNVAAAQFRRGVIDRLTAEGRMQKAGMPADRIAFLLDMAVDEIETDAQFKCAGFLIDRFVQGEFDANQLENMIRGLGIPAPHALAMRQRAECEREAAGKMPGTEQLCRWLELGLINAVQFIDRCKQLGWSDADATNILVACMTKINATRAKEAEAQAKRDAAAAEKLAKQLQKAAADVEKQRLLMERNRAAANKANAKREATIVDAGGKLAGLLGIPLSAAVQIVRDEKKRIQVAAALTVDDAIAAVVLAIDSGPVSPPSEFTGAVDDAASALLSASAEIPPAGSNGTIGP